MSVFEIFFFFKQKTAYELRISDWSSDVCSSDLERLASATDVVFDKTGTLGDGKPTLEAVDQCSGIDEAQALRIAASLERNSGHPLAVAFIDAGDRKSVVSGKSVSVRVDLGGRRIIKKQKHQHNRKTTRNT